MTAYADSSAVVPLYVTEEFSETAEAVLRPLGQVPFTLIHQLEIPNVFERLVGRGLITREQARLVHRQLEDDVENRRLKPVTIDLERAFRDAVELSGRFAAKHLARSLDLLHVAAAHVLSCTTFVSADDRQLRVARGSGLKVVDIKRRRRRRR